MTEAHNITPEIRQFLDEKFPKDSAAPHTLVLGEQHTHSDHIAFLHKNLDELQARGLTTLGLEYAPRMNVFNWAYEDGTLERELGSKQKAQDYLRAIYTANVANVKIATVLAHTNLAIAAMDRGIRVVCCDGREKGLPIKATFDSNPYFAIFPLEEYALANHLSIEECADKIRKNASGEGKAFIKTLDPVKRLSWNMAESYWLLVNNPQYVDRLATVERLLQAGHKKIDAGKMGSDGLSALTFDCLARPTGHRIKIIGFSHINGMGKLKEDAAEHIDGTFPDHLDAISNLFDSGPDSQPRTHRVTKAIVAGVAMGDGMADDYKRPVIRYRPIAGKDPIPYVNIDEGTVRNIPRGWGVKTVTLEEKIAKSLQEPLWKSLAAKVRGRAKPASETAEAVKCYINPLLMPDIKATADAVRLAMNGPDQGRPR